MPENDGTMGVSEDAGKEKEIVFLCKFCCETKPIKDLVVMRQFYPPISSCKDCARATRNAPWKT